MLAEVYLKAKRTADGMALLTTLQRVTTNPDVKQKTIALLDELTPTQPIFTEIRPEDLPAPRQAREAAPDIPAVPVPQPSARETVLESLVPTGPTAKGEKVTGVLIAMDCANGLTLRVRTDRGTMEFAFLKSRRNPVLELYQQSREQHPMRTAKSSVSHSGDLPAEYRQRGEPLVVEFLEATTK